jgi:hypothetical protein
LIVIDESTGITDMQLAVFVQGANEDFQVVEELLEPVLVKGKTCADEDFSELVTPPPFFVANLNYVGKNGLIHE